MDKPPDVIPDGLSAKEYYKLGCWYQEALQSEKAREALDRAIAEDPEGETGIEAQRFRDNRLTRHPIPELVLKKYQEASISAITKPPAAEKAFLALIEECPEFEWPFRGLAEIRLNKGDTQKALDYIEKSLAINPNNGQTLTVQTRTYIALGDYDRANASLDKATEMLPEDQNLRDLRRSLEILIHINA